MVRVFFQGNKQCPSNCQYCFAKWSGIYPRFNKAELDYIANNIAIIYPCCDSDFCLQENIYTIIHNSLNDFKEVYISLSTKNNIEKSQWNTLVKIDSELRKEKRGFIKLSVSFSTKYLLQEIEPNTLGYRQRIQLLQTILENNMVASVVIKPMLPFVTLEEYYEIVDDTAFAKNYLLGGLYVNDKTPFYKNYIYGKYKTTHRHVKWLPDDIAWSYVEQSNRENNLHQYISEKGLKCFSTDKDLILSLLK